MMFRLLREKFLRVKEKAEEETVEIVGESGRKIKEHKLDALLYDLELVLLESDVALPVVKEIVDKFAEEVKSKKLTRKLSFEEGIEEALRRAVEKVLDVPSFDLFSMIEKKEKPFVIMFVGVNGTGKTTVIAKLAHALQKKGYSCVLAASDTFRAGAIEQLEKHSERLGVKLVKHQAGSDPAAVAYDAIEHAKARKRDVVLIDTAGRMQTNVNLMDQMKKIKRVTQPHLVIFAGDALTGNDAVEQAKSFEDAVGLDGIILSKIDADAKGGAALSIAHAIGKPILFVGTGQGYEDLVPYNPKWMVDRLFAKA